MGLQINQNVAALNAYRNLSVTDGQLSKSLERLSSGLRINRAADDAAGLAISEKLRGQVKGLNQAVANAQNGISLIQTAEGALNESHSILQRMRELAVQSANDTNTAADRSQIQKEVDQLSQELSRIGATTEFNTKKLLDGSFTTAAFQIGANEGQTLNVSVGDMRGYTLGTAGQARAEQAATVGGGAETLADGTYTVKDNGGTLELFDSSGTKVSTAAIAAGTITNNTNGTADAADATYAFGNLTDGDTVVVSNSGTAASATVGVTNSGLEAGDYTISAGKVLDASGNQVGTYDGAGTVNNMDGTAVAQFGAISGAATLAKFTVGGVDVSTAGAASKAITTVQSAIDTVSAQRSTLGAVQNRLDHTINNLNVAAENLTASESRIRDTDMAKEMTSFTRAQILSQAGTAMLAQANQVPQSVLRLLG